MTREDIMRLLQECGFGTLMDHPIMTENMMHFAALVAAEKDKEIERLREALKWSRDVDCGCCSYCVEPPDEFRDLIEWADEIKREQPR